MISQIFAFDRRVALFNALIRGEPVNSGYATRRHETRTKLLETLKQLSANRTVC